MRPTTGNGGKTLAQYISPAFGGFKAQLGYQPKGDNVALLTGADAAQAKAAYAVAFSYAAGPLAAAVSYESAASDNATLATSLGNTWSGVSASYDFTVAKLVATYANGGTNFKGYNLGVAVPVAGASVGVQYSKNTDTNGTGVELFANKEVLKNTTSYVDYGKKHVDSGTTAGDYDVYSIGFIWAF